MYRSKNILISFLIILPVYSFSQQVVRGLQASIAADATVNPITSGLAEDFNFGDATKISLSGTAINSITGVNGTVSSQSNATFKPVYHATGGPNNYGYGQFNNSYLSGSLITSGTTYTIIVLKKCDTTIQQGSFYNGGTTDGYGSTDGIALTAAINTPGGTMLGVTNVQTFGAVTVTGLWTIESFSHSTGVSKYTNNSGYNYTLQSGASNPITPTTGHNIGIIPGNASYRGAIVRILIYNRQLSDSEVASVMNWACLYYKLPLATNFNSGGDSITFGYNVNSGYPQRVMTSLIGSQYMYNHNTGVNGRQTSDVLANLNTEVLSLYNSKINNVYTLMIGRNDLVGLLETPQQIFNNIVSICQQAKSAGYRVVVMTVLKSTHETGSPTILANWTALNTLIRNNWASFADSFYDAAAISQASDPTNTTYFQDGVHPTDALDAIIAAGLAPIVSALIYN